MGVDVDDGCAHKADAKSDLYYGKVPFLFTKKDEVQRFPSLLSQGYSQHVTFYIKPALLFLLFLFLSVAWNHPFWSLYRLRAIYDRFGFKSSHDMSLSNQASLTGNLSLNPLTFAPLPLGSIKPLGWLDDQLRLMSDGLAGHEHDFYPIVSDSVWLGGQSEYSPLNEGIPYWLNGLVPLAYSLDDDRLQRQTDDVVDYILNHQQSDGWLGPEEPADRDIWGRFPLCLGLMQLVDANKSKSAQVLPALYDFVSLMHLMLIRNNGFGEFWGRVRYADMTIVLQWLLEKHPGNHTHTLLETMSLLNGHGLRWADYYNRGNYIFKDLDEVQPPITGDSVVFPYVHAVNAAQGMKAGAVIYRFNDDASLLESARNGVNWTLTYHGDPAGSITGDERESGLAPNRGSELCTAVETMYSLSYLYQAMGDKVFADRCERAAFNALPVMFTNDLWAHQYLVLPNQPFSHSLHGPNPFWNTGDQSILYGAAPNYPCCTVNMPQGLPKFLSASFVQVGANGIGHALLSPARVTTTLPSGTHVSLACNTTYPFTNTFDYTFNASAPFTLHLRLPSWASGYEIHATSGSGATPKIYTAASLPSDTHTGMLALDLLETGSVTYNLRTDIRTEDRGNDTISVYHGALLYALDVGFSDSSTTKDSSISVSGTDPLTNDTEAKNRIPAAAHDHYIMNTNPWNIAIDPATLVYHTAGNGGEYELPNPIWAYQAPPGYITAQGCEIAWGIEMQVPAVPPAKGERACVGEVREVVLRPYGSLKVHMAVLPVMER
ncbi:MAG: hypothetical protein Q9177_004738 [Variospora cf. flavescens]